MGRPWVQFGSLASHIMTLFAGALLCSSIAWGETFTVTDAPLDPGNLDSFVLFGDDLYYGVRVESERRAKLIRIDGDTGEHEAVFEVPDSRAPLNIRSAIAANDAIYFVSAPLLSYFGALWKHSPATGETILLKEFTNLAPRELACAGNYVFLATWSTLIARSGLWRTDGTPEGTIELATGIIPENLTTLEPYVYFTSLGRDFYRVGTTGGVRTIIEDINFRDSINRRFVRVFLRDFRIYFLASADANKTLELWSTDGSTRGTRQETFINPATLPSGRTEKELPDLKGAVSTGAEPPFLGLVEGELVFSYQRYPFWYFYRFNPNAPDGSSAELLTEQPIAYLLPFDEQLLLLGPPLVGRRDLFLFFSGTLISLNQVNSFGTFPGPLLSRPDSAYFVDTSDASSGEPPNTFDFPLLRLDRGKFEPSVVPVEEDLEGMFFAGVAAATDEQAYIGALDLTGMRPPRMVIMKYDDPVIAEGEGEGMPEGASEGEGEGEGTVDGEGEPVMGLPELAQLIFDGFARADTDENERVSAAELDAATIEYTLAQFVALDSDDDDALTRNELIAGGAVAPPPGCACAAAESFDQALNRLLGDWVTLLVAVTALVLMRISMHRHGA